MGKVKYSINQDNRKGGCNEIFRQESPVGSRYCNSPLAGIHGLLCQQEWADWNRLHCQDSLFQRIRVDAGSRGGPERGFSDRKEKFYQRRGGL